MESAGTELQAVREQLTGLLARVGAAEAALAQPAATLSTLQEAIGQAEALAAATNLALAEARRARDTALAERDSALLARTGAENELAAIGQALASRQAVLAVVEIAEGRVAELSARVEALTETLRVRREEVTEIEVTAETLRADVQRRREEIAALAIRRAELLEAVRIAGERSGEANQPSTEIPE